MTDLTVLGEFVNTAVAIISWIGVAAVACSMVLVILFASMPAFDWLFTTSRKPHGGDRRLAGEPSAISPTTPRSLQEHERPAEAPSGQTKEKIPSNLYTDIYSTPPGTYVLPC